MRNFYFISYTISDFPIDRGDYTYIVGAKSVLYTEDKNLAINKEIYLNSTDFLPENVPLGLILNSYVSQTNRKDLTWSISTNKLDFTQFTFSKKSQIKWIVPFFWAFIGAIIGGIVSFFIPYIIRYLKSLSRQEKKNRYFSQRALIRENIKVEDKSKNRKIDNYWAGITIGIGGGLISSIWVAYYFRWLDHLQDMTLASITIMASFLLLILFIFLHNKIYKNSH